MLIGDLSKLISCQVNETAAMLLGRSISNKRFDIECELKAGAGYERDGI